MAKVTLIAYTPDPERTVAAAAKLCYSASSVDKLLDGLTPEKTAGFLEMLAQLGVTEMNFSSRKVEAVLSVNDSTLKAM